MSRRALPAAMVALGAAGLTALVLAHRDEVGAALARIQFSAFAAATALHVGVLACRSEAWRACLLAALAEGTEPLTRCTVHGANAMAYGVGAVQPHGALPTRIAALRAMAGERAPANWQIAFCDVPILLLEVALTGTVMVVAVGIGGGSPWVATLVLALGAGGLAAAFAARRRFRHRPALRGLAVLAHPRHGPMAVMFVAALGGLGLVRLAVLLAAAGAPHEPVEVALVFGALGAAGLLPLGPNASPSATLAVVGSDGIAAALAAGLAIAATTFAAVAIYGAVALGWSVVATRRRRVLLPAAVHAATSPGAADAAPPDPA